MTTTQTPRSLPLPISTTQQLKDVKSVDEYVTDLSGILQKNKQLSWSKIRSLLDTVPKGDLRLEQWKLYLKSFGAIRERLVKDYYDACSAKLDTRYSLFGSTNITSDLDITITGKNAPEVVWCMILNFVRKNGGKMAAEMFDSNFYCVGFFDCRGNNQALVANGTLLQFNCSIPSGLSILNAVTKKDIDTCLTYACMKLAKQQGYLPNTLRNKALVAEQNANNEITSKITEQQSLIQQYGIKGQEDVDIFIRYLLQVMYAKAVNQVVYASDPKAVQRLRATLFENVCKSQFYSMESYYTPMTVLVVVLYMQGNQLTADKISKFAFLCSVLENAGYLYEHMMDPTATTDISADILNYSKYLYRVFESMAGIYSKYPGEQNPFRSLADNLKKYVVSKRGTKVDQQVIKSLIQHAMLKQKTMTKDTYIKSVLDYTLGNKIFQQVLQDTLQSIQSSSSQKPV